MRNHEPCAKALGNYYYCYIIIIITAIYSILDVRISADASRRTIATKGSCMPSRYTRKTMATHCTHIQVIIIGERSEPHTYRTVGKNLRHIYIYVFYIYIYIYTSVRRAHAVNARATRKRRTGRLRFNGQYNRLENGYFSSKL